MLGYKQQYNTRYYLHTYKETIYIGTIIENSQGIGN